MYCECARGLFFFAFFLGFPSTVLLRNGQVRTSTPSRLRTTVAKGLERGLEMMSDVRLVVRTSLYGTERARPRPHFYRLRSTTVAKALQLMYSTDQASPRAPISIGYVEFSLYLPSTCLDRKSMRRKQNYIIYIL